MEEKGIRTQLGDYNRQIRAHNNALRNLKRLIADLTAWMKSIVQKLEDAKKKDEPQPTILDFIHAYDDLQKAGRLTWSVKGRQTAAVNDLKLASKVLNWMQATGIRTLDDLQNAVSVHSEAFSRISENKKAIRRIDKVLETGIVPLHKPSIKEILDQPKPSPKPSRTKQPYRELE